MFSLISEHILLYSKYIGINVSIDYRIFESSVSIFVANIILCFTLEFAVSIYYFIMVLLTIDRILVFHLKFRYHFYFSPSKILKLIVAVASVSFLNSTILAILTSMQRITWFKVENKIFLVYVVFVLVILSLLSEHILLYPKYIGINENSVRRLKVLIRKITSRFW